VIFIANTSRFVRTNLSFAVTLRENGLNVTGRVSITQGRVKLDFSKPPSAAREDRQSSYRDRKSQDRASTRVIVFC
jgi:hypothetical protein